MQPRRQTPSGAVLLSYRVAQTAGNLNVVVVGWNDTTSTVSSVSDSRGNTYTQAGPGDGHGIEAVDLLRPEYRWGQQHGDGDVQPGGGLSWMYGSWSTAVWTRRAAGCDGGSSGDSSEREQRSGDHDVGQRVDFWGGDDGGDVWRIGDGIRDPDHHAGFRHRAGQDGEQHGELQCVGDADVLLALGDADGDVPGGALMLRQWF